MTTENFLSFETGPDAGSAFLSGSFEDMANYPPTGLGLKNSFRLVELPAGETAEVAANRLLADAESGVSQATGHAGCIEIEVGQFLFFGRVPQRKFRSSYER